MLRTLLATVIACVALPALAQSCPQEDAKGAPIDSQARPLEGTLIYHDGIRKWFELKLDLPQCGQSSIQLIRIEGKYTPLEVLRGCRVRSTGAISEALTGYYSLDLAQDVKQIEPVDACKQQTPFPDYSHAMPDKTVRDYRVEMEFDYDPLNAPIHFRVTSDGKELKPWQAYASYMLTGGFVLYGMCAEGFAVDEVFGTPQASPSHFTERGGEGDRAMFDPDSAASSGHKQMHLGYTCVRRP